ncbi:hypothetical protein R6Z07F_013483 [Ovis aries]
MVRKGNACRAPAVWPAPCPGPIEHPDSSELPFRGAQANGTYTLPPRLRGRRHALGARAARGAREAALGGARRPAATYTGLSRGGPGCACAPGLRAARGQTGGRWDAREARGPAREPPGAGQKKLNKGPEFTIQRSRKK